MCKGCLEDYCPGDCEWDTFLRRYDPEYEPGSPFSRIFVPELQDIWERKTGVFATPLAVPGGNNPNPQGG